MSGVRQIDTTGGARFQLTTPRNRVGYVTETTSVRGTHVATSEIRVVPTTQSRHEHVAAASDLLTVINSLGEEGLGLRRPLRMRLEVDADGEVTATFADAGLAMSGTDIRDAVCGLRDEIVETYNLYRNEPRLGPEAARRLRVLETYIVEGRNKALKSRS